MMHLMDTDHISLVDRGNTAGQNIKQRLANIPPDDVAVSIISYEEQIRGWTSVIAQARTVERQLPFYSELERVLRFYCITPLLQFDARAAREFVHLRQAGVRIGTMDLKIASIALANDAIVLTCNLVDFSKVPNLKYEDWSA